MITKIGTVVSFMVHKMKIKKILPLEKVVNSIYSQIQNKRWSINLKTQHCVKAAIAFLCKSCQFQLLYTSLQVTTFVCTIAIDHLWKHHRFWYASFKFTISVCTIWTGISTMSCCIWYLCTIKIFISFYIWQLLYASFEIANCSIELLKYNYLWMNSLLHEL